MKCLGRAHAFGLLIAATAGSMPAQIAVAEVETTSTQAVLHYAAPDTNPCVVEISESPTYRPLVNDVDPEKFQGASQDLRPGSLQIWNFRLFVAGTRATQRGLDGILYSRALQAATQHYYRITCGGSIQEGTFTTSNVPFGLTYSDAIPADPENAGETLWPVLDYADRTKTYVDPQTGVLLRRLTGPADIHGAGLAIDPRDLTADNVDTFPRTGSAWSGQNFPYSVVANNTDFLVLLAHGLIFWPSYPFSWQSQTYASDAQGSLNWVKLKVTAATSNSACDSNASDDCKILVCLSVDRVSCHPWSVQTEQALTSSPKEYSFGNANYTNQGGWLTRGHRWLNPPETVDRAGAATCDGSPVVQGGPFNLAWTKGTPITIGGAIYLIQSVQHEAQVTLQSNCPPGNFDYSSTTLSFLVRAKAASNATIAIQKVQAQWDMAPSPQWPAGAYYDVCGMAAVNRANDKPGFTCLIAPGQGFYWVDAETGDTRLIGRNIASAQTTCFGLESPIDPLNPAKFYCYDRATDQVLTFEYKGDFSDRVQGFDPGFDTLPACNDAVNPANSPCNVNGNLTEGLTFVRLVQQFDPAYDKTKFSCCIQAGTNQLGQLVLSAFRSGVNQSLMWIMVFDPNVASNGEPGNAGCVSAVTGDPSRKGCVVAAIPAWLRGDMRGQPTKLDVLANVAPGWINTQPYTWSGGPTDGRGPWIMTTSGAFQFQTGTDVPGGLTDCPQNPYATGKVCTEVSVDSEPFDPDPGPTETGAPGEYFVVQPGDYLYIDNPLGNHDLSHELVRVVARTGYTLVVARGVRYGAQACEPQPAGTCGSGGPIQTSKVNPVLSVAAIANKTYWDYADDPHGLLGLILSDPRDSGSHSFTRFGSYVEAYNGTFDPRCTAPVYDGCYGFRLNPAVNDIPRMLATPRSGFSAGNPGFAGKYGLGTVNEVQSHPAGMGHLPATDRERQFFVDGRPYNGRYSPGDPAAAQAVQVGGSLWKFPADPKALDRKFLPTKAQASWHPLLDVSGPNSRLSTGADDNFKYCVVVAAEECHPGSAPAEIYFNAPFLRYNYCVYPGQATPGADLSDICIHNQAFVSDNLTQGDMSADADNLGLKQRALTKGLSPSKVNVPFWNISVLPNNKWAIFRTRFVNGFRNEVLLLKMPPLDQDDKDRTKFVPLPVEIANVPDETTNVVVEFGYAENGPPEQLYCTSRQETCGVGYVDGGLQVDPANPFFFSGTEAALLAGMPCSSSCTVNVPLISQRVVYYRVRYRDAGNATLAVSGLQAQTSPY